MRYGVRFGLLAVMSIVVCVLPVLGQQTVSIGQLVHDPDRYDGKVVAVVGTVTAYRERVSGGGNPYTTLHLSDGEATVAVFIWNKQGLGNGQRVRVTGTFSKVRQVGTVTFANEIQAYRIEAVP